MSEHRLPGQAAGAAVPSVAAPERASQFGLGTAVALIMGSIIGVGIFNLPSSLAPIGPITLVSLGLTTVGAVALAVMFSALSRRLPADGGPYAYARVAFGNGIGFMNAWSYWITAWAGNAAIAVGWVLYVEHFINKSHNTLFSIVLVLIGLWIPAVINLSGVQNMGAIQVITTILKFGALAFVSLVGLFFINTAHFTPWNVSGQSAALAIGSGMAIALFSYLGVETAAVAAGKVKDPDRNVPRATILGTLACAAVYVLSLVVIFGVLPNATLRETSAPFSAAVDTMFGGTLWGNLMAIVVIISGLGALNGWTMICAEMPLAAAKDGLFPARFKQLSRSSVPAFGIVASTLLACSSAAPSSPPDFCAQFYQALCERAVSCSIEPNIATCQNVTNANSGYPAACGTLTCSAGLSFDATQAQTCVSDEQAASCADIGGNVQPPSCNAICH